MSDCGLRIADFVLVINSVLTWSLRRHCRTKSQIRNPKSAIRNPQFSVGLSQGPQQILEHLVRLVEVVDVLIREQR